MLKKCLYLVMSVVACIGLSSSIASAAASCTTVSVAGVGTTPYTDSGLFVKVTNTSGATCFGDLADGETRKFYLNEEGADRTYATFLTALSLEKELYVQVGGTGERNSLILIASTK